MSDYFGKEVPKLGFGLIRRLYIRDLRLRSRRRLLTDIPVNRIHWQRS